MHKKNLNTATIFDIPLFGGSSDELLKMVQNDLFLKQTTPMWWLNTPNAEQVVQASDDDIFRSYLQQSLVNLPDGMSVVLAARLLRQDATEYPRERISGVDFMQALCALAADQGWRVFLLGGLGQVAEFTAQKLRVAYPGIHIDYDPGPQDIGRESPEEATPLLAKIAKFKTQILFVGFGAPRQERWVMQHKKQLEQMGVRLVMVVGGAFDMVSGNIARAPEWMRAGGLEWLWRLGQEPWRWRRQLRLFRFWFMVMRAKLRGK